MPEITCEDCARPYDAARANAKRCTLCRLLRDWLACEANPERCDDCRQRFLRSHRYQRECPSCDLIYAGLSPSARRARKLLGHGGTRAEGLCEDGCSCAICKGSREQAPKRPFPLIHPELRLCTGCAAAPENRDQVRRAIKRKIRSLRESSTMPIT